MKEELTDQQPNNTGEEVIRIEGLYKSFGKNKVLQGLDLSVRKGENVVVLGKSGSGKSVLIKCLIRLEKADEGMTSVLGADTQQMDHRELNETRIRTGFLFQSGALYDSMSVGENLMFPLKRHSPGKSTADLRRKVLETLDQVGLKDAVGKMPSELSGGMRKRIAVARTLILNPEIMLYDEPTTGLDSITSREISELIVEMQRRLGITSIIITHDMPCARITADRIVMLKEGAIYAEGTYEELERSDDEWIRSFFI